MNKITSKYKLFIGVDWANDKHDVCIQFPNGDRQFSIINSSPEFIHEWILALHKKYHGKIAISIELSKGPIVYALEKYDFVTIFPIQPLMLARYRQAFSPSGAKDDPTDAQIALDLMLNYPEKIKSLNNHKPETRQLAFLVEQRRRLVEDKRRFTNRLINTLKQYYPQPLEWFSHRDSELFCDFLTRWPSLTQLKRARPATVRNFFAKRGGNAVSNTDKRLASIVQSVPLTNDSAIIEPHSLMMLALVKQMKTLVLSIRDFDKKINYLFNQADDASLFKSFPGTGPCLAPRLYVALGEKRGRFNSAEEIQKYAGVAPVTERSGQKSWVHWRWQCSKFLRQSFIEWAAKTVNTSYWAGIYYQKQREKGKSHQTAVRALAFKWIRILFRCWKTRMNYDESKYLKSLKERKSPLLVLSV